MEVRVKILTIGLNYVDILMIKGSYQFKNTVPFVPGIEACGIIIEQNCDNESLIGKKVIVTQKHGCFSEEVITNFNNIIVINKKIKSHIASCFFIAYLTAYVSLYEIAKAKKNETILVTGASGGIGNAIILLSRKLNLKIFAVSKSLDKHNTLYNLGVKYCFKGDENIKQKILEINNKDKIDIIADITGLQKHQNLIGSLKWGGKYLILGFMENNFSKIKTNHILIKGLKVYGIRAGEYLRRNIEKKNTIMNNLYQLLKSNISLESKYTFISFKNLKKGLSLMKSRKVSGKIIIKTKYFEDTNL